MPFFLSFYYCSFSGSVFLTGMSLSLIILTKTMIFGVFSDGMSVLSVCARLLIYNRVVYKQPNLPRLEGDWVASAPNRIEKVIIIITE